MRHRFLRRLPRRGVGPAGWGELPLVRAEVRKTLIHGSKGLIYFVQEFKPRFREAALLDDPQMLKAVTGINRQIRELAPALNSPAIPDGAHAKSSSPEVPVDTTVRR